MSKIIKLTEEYIEECKKDFEEQLKASRLSDGKISFNKSFGAKDDKAIVYFTPMAYAKMILVLREFNKEVAWQGVAERLEEIVTPKGIIVEQYLISDIMVYPQIVTGATVDMDMDAYGKWYSDFLLKQMEADAPSNISVQGHSHVNMAVTPSGTDIRHQEQVLQKEVGEDDFYIFMIWNKRLESHMTIYDMQKNTKFENADVLVEIWGDEWGLDDFIDGAKNIVVEKTYAYNPPANKAAAKPDERAGKNAEKAEKKNKREIVDEDDDDITEWFETHGYGDCRGSGDYYGHNSQYYGSGYGYNGGRSTR